MKQSVWIRRALTTETTSNRGLSEGVLVGLGRLKISRACPLFVYILLIALSSLCGCVYSKHSSKLSQNEPSPSRSFDRSSDSPVAENSFLEEGVISFSKPVPIAAVIPTIEASSIFSFMPIAPVIPDFGVKSYNSNEMWVFIDSFNNSIEINKGDENILTAQAKSSSGTTQGKFSVALKEENALWYANDNYFAKRSQRMPAEGSSDRYRKGALGEYAVFLSGGMVIHSSPLFDDSVTGFQVTEDEIRSIYNLLQPGTKIIIR